MFGLFKKKSKEDRLQEKYKSLMDQAFKLSKVNRSQSDQKYFEADEILKQIENLKKV